MSKELKYELGQIIGINGFIARKEIIIAKLLNPELTDYEKQYLTLRIDTFLCPEFRAEYVINNDVEIEEDIFENAKHYNFTKYDMEDRYNSILNYIELHKKDIKSSSGKELNFEIISENSFYTLLD